MSTPQSRPASPARPTTLDDLVATVARARQTAQAAIAPITAARQQFDAAMAPLVGAKEAAFAALDAAEEALRAATLAAYTTSGAKRPHPAAGIRVGLRLVYDRDALTAYAREHLRQVLVLDVKAFERVAVTLATNGAPIAGVQIVEEVQATIAQDLGSYLPPVAPGALPVPAAGADPLPSAA